MCYAALIPAGLSVLGGITQGNAQSAQLNSQASQARTNANFANAAANDAVKRGTYDADLQRVRTARSIGTQRTAQAANGGEVNSGSNADLQADTAALGELDALTIQNNAAREAYGYKVQALTGYSNARQLEAQSSSAKSSSLLGGILKGGVYAFAGGVGGFGGTATPTSSMFSGSSTFNSSAYA